MLPESISTRCASLGFDGEVEVTSLAGSVREACLWSPGLADAGVRRRATMLDTAEEITDAEPDDCAVAPAGRWIVDPDGAVVRAGLVRHYAARHGLWQLDPDIAYLSGDRLPDGVRGFEVLEQFAFSERHLRQALSARDVGALEILVRGVDVDPDALRPRLRLRGSTQLSWSSPGSVPGRQAGQRHSSAVRHADRTRTLAATAPKPESAPIREDGSSNAHSRRCRVLAAGVIAGLATAPWPGRRRRAQILAARSTPSKICRVHVENPIYTPGLHVSRPITRISRR